jgi:hypothetical protein
MFRAGTGRAKPSIAPRHAAPVPLPHPIQLLSPSPHPSASGCTRAPTLTTRCPTPRCPRSSAARSRARCCTSRRCACRSTCWPLTSWTPRQSAARATRRPWARPRSPQCGRTGTLPSAPTPRSQPLTCVPATSTLPTPNPTPHPPARRGGLEEALTRLYVLDALDADGDITPVGRQMANLPLEPALARALLAAHELGWAAGGGGGAQGRVGGGS